jgi:hypothetical protein
MTDIHDTFFECCKSRNLKRADELYEHNHIDVMFNDNCVVKHAIISRHLDVIKWLMDRDDYTQCFTNEEEEDSDGQLISLMTLACRYKYYDLIAYLVSIYYELTYMDMNELLKNQKNVGIVEKVHRFSDKENIVDECIEYAETSEIIEWMIAYGYVITDDMLYTTNNNVMIKFARVHDMIDDTKALDIMLLACTRDRLDILVYMMKEFTHVTLDMYTVYTSVYGDPIKCIGYLEKKTGYIKSLNVHDTQCIMNNAMMHMATRVVRYLYKLIGVKPLVCGEIDVDHEYTKCALEFFQPRFTVKHLGCADEMLFDLILNCVEISSENIDDAISSIMQNENENNVNAFVCKLNKLEPGIASMNAYGNMFVFCCVRGYMVIAKEMWIQHGYLISYSTMTLEDLVDTTTDGWRYNRNHTMEGIVNTPKKLMKLVISGPNVSIECIAWIANIYNVILTYRNIDTLISNDHPSNDKMLMYMLLRVNLTEPQLGNVFSHVLFNCCNPYYITKYLIGKYKEWITPKLRSVLFRNSLYHTSKAFTLLDDCSYSVHTSLMTAIYGCNIQAYTFLMEKHTDCSRSKTKSDTLFRYACTCDSLEIVKYMCSTNHLYEFKMDDDSIVPIIKNTFEYFIEKRDMKSVTSRMKKAATIIDECGICYDKGNTKTFCNHVFCIECLTKWYMRSHACPMCKQPINMKKCSYKEVCV